MRLGYLAQTHQTPRVVGRQIVFVGVPTRSVRGTQYSSLAETARNTQTVVTISSNEPGSDIEMMPPLRAPGGAANNPNHLPEEEDGVLETSQ